MNKLGMGPATAVSCYHKIFRFFVNNDTPNVCDQDFRESGYLIVSSGYMALQPNSHESKEEYSDVTDNDILKDTVEEVPAESEKDCENKETGLSLDKSKRPHYKRLSAGPTFIQLRASKFDSSSGMIHANDLLQILHGQHQDGKGIDFVKDDKGSDWNLLSVPNNIYMCRAWKVKW